MPPPDYTLKSNPVRAAAARVVVGVIGAVLTYVALPAPFEQHWLAAVSVGPAVAGVALLALAFFAPTRWCEALLTLVP